MPVTLDRPSSPLRPAPTPDPRANTRRTLSLGVLVAMTALGVLICVRMVLPFIPGLAWALALAVTTMPLHLKLLRWFRWPNVAALISVTVVAVLLLTPAVFLGIQIGKQASTALTDLQHYVESGRWRQTLNRSPILRSVLQAVNADQTPEQSSREIVPQVQRQAGATLRSAPWLALQIGLALFTLFFLFRDRAGILKGVRSLLPMSEDEATYFFARIGGMTHATIYGTIVVALVQGGLGGLIFLVVGLPNPLLWGVVMAMLAMIPGLGAFVIWLPAGIFLAMQGDWTRAMIVLGWGLFVVATIDNILFPTLVGKEMRLHTLPVFLTIVGGLAVFGAAGLVLGPVTLAATVALIDILKQRLATRLT